MTVTNNGQLTTFGDGAYGIEAQSIGGGGGNGGGAISVAVGLKAGSPGNTVNASVAVGGNGGSGNTGGDVTVDQTGGITTSGAGSHGIIAQSIGGGGGVGGRANSLAFALAAQCTLPVPIGGCGTPPGAGTNVNINVAVGGVGGTGNDAGTVNVHNHSAISTIGDSSVGILAQSIGGGGGEAGNGAVGLGGGLTDPIPIDLSNVLIPISSATPLSPKVAIGGSGGASGTGGSVNVTDDGAINTSSNNASGIVAQSIGGGGGRGGNASPGLTGILGIGGTGGSSGDGGAVTVTLSSTGSISTSGSHSRGIFAQSIGGGGGEGGGDLLGIITIGGDGGSGGNGGDVTVTSNGTISTGGGSSEGVAAQSIGGGGGMANATSGVFAFGGMGGSAGTGGTVAVINTAGITTGGAASNAIFAQSIGGGGGAGAGANGVFSFGGSGGSTGDGGHVTVNNQSTGSITTSGDLAYGIYAQSVGGGGGGGGNVVSGSAVAGVSVGGSGAAAGSGGIVDVTNSGSITTNGLAALAIFAQSVGGGGGNGGYSGNYSGVVAFTVGVGGNGGASGDGGNVNVTNTATGTITTNGAGATAIFAQSVGGGGGQGAGAMTITAGGGANLALGGSGASGGMGGNVTVTNDGAITTHGINSVAIFAQSVGGGGGVAGSALAVTVGPGVFIGGSSGANGKGGDVTVTNNGSVTMTGNGSVGLFAQSVGGGGGLATAADAATYALNAQGDGNGGAVSVVNHGTITLTGDNSAGVFVQSVGGGGGVIGKSGDLLGLDPMFQGTAGGTGTAADVNLVQDHDVTATGLNSFGLLLQSAGGTGNGNITATITPGTTIIGGSGTGAGVGFLGGVTNVLTNNGTVTSVNQIAGYAMTATDGNDTIENYGTMTGSVDLGAGTNAFNNYAGAVYNMGANTVLGAGNTLTNSGTVSPGGVNNVFTSGVTGNFAQTAAGAYLLDLDFDANGADRLNVVGTGTLAGLLQLNFLNKDKVLPGDHQVTVFSATLGTTHAGFALSAASSAIVTYGLSYPNANDAVLSYNINFNPPNLPPQYHSIGNAINRIQTDRTSPGFGPIASALFDLPNIAALQTFYDAVGGGGTATTQQTAIIAGGMFDATLVDQVTAWLNGTSANEGVVVDESALGYAGKGDSADKKYAMFTKYRPRAQVTFEDRWRAWTSAFGSHQLVDGNSASDVPGSTVRSAGGAFGVERQLGGDLLYGFAVGESQSNFSVTDWATSGRLVGGHFGLYGVMRRDAFYISGNLGYSRYDNSTERTVYAAGLPSETAKGEFNSDQLFGRFEVGRRQQLNQVAITPFEALQFSQLWQQGYTESSSAGGAPGILGLTYAQQQTYSLQSNLGLQFDSKVIIGDSHAWTPYLRASWMHEFNPNRGITAAFNVAPGYQFTTVGVPAVSDALEVVAGGSFSVNANASLFSTFSGQFSGSSQSYAASGGVRVLW